MSRYQIEWLEPGRSWNPTALVAPAPETMWGGNAVLIAVEALASLVGSAMLAQDELAVVTPAGIDSMTGKVLRTRRGYAGVVRRLGSKSEDLIIGDVLVPASAAGPAVLLAAAHEGLAFSGAFHALRPNEPLDGLWLWACLSSRSGERARAAAVLGEGSSLRRLTAASLRAMLVPAPGDPHHQAESLRELAAAAADVDRSESAGSWWRISDLPKDGRWHPHAFIRDPGLLERGVPLSELADVRQGRRPQQSHDAPSPGLLPVLLGKSIDARGVTAWAAPGAAPEIVPGDVLVTEIGLRGRAVLADVPALAGPGVIRIRPFDLTASAGIAAYLRSEAAQAVRQQLAATTVIPRLSAATMRRFPVELKAAYPHQEGSEFRPSLADRLEQLLWSR